MNKKFEPFARRIEAHNSTYFDHIILGQLLSLLVLVAERGSPELATEARRIMELFL